MTVDPIVSQLASHGVAFAPQIAGAARRHGLDPELLAAVAAQETGGPGSNAGRNIVGDGGHGRGVFQIDDRWHDFAKTTDAMKPADNADYAAGMLEGLLHRYGGNVREALSAYNSGSPTSAGTRTQWGDGENLGYADSVLRHYERLSRTDAPPAPLSSSGADTLVAAVSGDTAATSTSAAPDAWLARIFSALGALESPMLQPPQSSSAAAPAQYQQQTIDYGALLDDQN